MEGCIIGGFTVAMYNEMLLLDHACMVKGLAIYISS